MEMCPYEKDGIDCCPKHQDMRCCMDCKERQNCNDVCLFCNLEEEGTSYCSYDPKVHS